MNRTPRAERVHIAIYGRTNSGKSSLVNAITGQRAAIVSEIAGTTTDPVSKNMEVPGLGAVKYKWIPNSANPTTQMWRHSTSNR